MGFIKDGKLVILSPRQKVNMFIPDFKSGTAIPASISDSLVNEAIAWYQGASYLFKKGKYMGLK